MVDANSFITEYFKPWKSSSVYENERGCGRRRSIVIVFAKRNAERKKSGKGQAIVEFAVVLPILLLLMLGLINLGVLINAQIILTQAAWEGARAGTTLNPSLGEGDTEIIGAVQTSLIGLSDPTSVTVNINPDEAARAAMPWPKPRGEALTIRLAYPMNLTLPLPITVTLGAQATSRIEYSN